MAPASIPLVALGGRYPFALARYDPQKIRAVIRRQDDTLLIRIDDITNLDRWEEFQIPFRDLTRLLHSPLPSDFLTGDIHAQ